MHFSPVVIAAFAAAVSAAPESHTSVPTPSTTLTIPSASTGFVQVGATHAPTSGAEANGTTVSLMTRKGKEGDFECFVRVASDSCNTDSKKVSDWDSKHGCYRKDPL